MRIALAGIIAGLLGGALDLVAAIIVYPLMHAVSVMTVLQSIASGVYGLEAFRGGAGMALQGAVFHLLIALVAGLVLAAAMAASAKVLNKAVATGVIFGLAVYAIMTFIIVPASNAAIAPPDARAMAVGVAIHVFMFGLPMAFAARRVLSA